MINNKEILTYLDKLIEGNKRFVNETQMHPNITKDIREELNKGQKPFATIITCSDSRVSPEILFDVGLGDIFVIRTAGHILDTAGLGTLEYAIHHLHTKLIIVMGHTNCGAVKSAVELCECCNEINSNLDKLVEGIKSSVQIAKKNSNNKEEILNKSIEYNIYNTIDCIKSSIANVEQMIKNGEIYIVPAKYNIDSGVVEILNY